MAKETVTLMMSLESSCEVVGCMLWHIILDDYVALLLKSQAAPLLGVRCGILLWRSKCSKLVLNVKLGNFLHNLLFITIKDVSMAMMTMAENVSVVIIFLISCTKLELYKGSCI